MTTEDLAQALQDAADECQRIWRATATAEAYARMHAGGDEEHPAYAQFFALRGQGLDAHERWIRARRRMDIARATALRGQGNAAHRRRISSVSA